MNDFEAQAKLHAKILAISTAIKYVDKQGKNHYFKYDYIRDVDILNAVRPEMSKHGVAITPEIIDVNKSEIHTVDKSGNSKASLHTLIKMVFHVTDIDTGFSVAHQWYGESGDGQDKGITQSLTSAQKYFLKTLFSISSEEPANDPDANDDITNTQSPSNAPERLQKRQTTKQTQAPSKNAQTGAQSENDPLFATSTDWAKFWVYIKNIGLTKDDVHDALKVDSAKDFAGTKSQAMFLIDAIAESKNKLMEKVN